MDLLTIIRVRRVRFADRTPASSNPTAFEHESSAEGSTRRTPSVTVLAPQRLETSSSRSSRECSTRRVVRAQTCESMGKGRTGDPRRSGLLGDVPEGAGAPSVEAMLVGHRAPSFTRMTHHRRQRTAGRLTMSARRPARADLAPDRSCRRLPSRGAEDTGPRQRAAVESMRAC